MVTDGKHCHVCTGGAGRLIETAPYKSQHTAPKRENHLHFSGPQTLPVQALFYLTLKPRVEVKLMTKQKWCHCREKLYCRNKSLQLNAPPVICSHRFRTFSELCRSQLKHPKMHFLPVKNESLFAWLPPLLSISWVFHLLNEFWWIATMKALK